VEIASYLIFFLAGLGFGFAAPGWWRWIPLVFPLALALVAALQEGVDGTLLIRLVVALLVTAAGVLLGVFLDRRGRRGEQVRYA
jgi:ABC-type phosphate transport system permease subunit